MAPEYDVIIVGGGPAGLSVARSVAEKGLSCLVIEKNENIGVPVKTSGGSWYSDMIRMGIDTKCLNPITKVSIISPSGIEAVMNFDKPVPCILDVTGTFQFLARDAIKKGAKLILNTKVVDIIKKGRFITGVITEHHEQKESFFGKVIVDASGISAVLTKKLHLIDNWARVGIGAEYDVSTSGLDSKHSILFMGKCFAPAGYGWFFPWKPNRTRIGVGIIHPDSVINPKTILDDFYNNKQIMSRLTNPFVEKEHFGMFPCSGPMRRTVLNGFVALGDAAGMGSPLYGEGIRYAIEFGQYAGKVITSSILNNDVSMARLNEFDKIWRKKEERNFKISLAIQKQLTRLNDRQWDKGVTVLKKLSLRNPDLVIQIFKGNFSNRVLWKIFQKFPIDILKLVLKEIV